MKKPRFRIACLFLMLAAAPFSRAQEVILDDVETAVEPDWAEIRIRFTMPVSYVSHFPREKGQLLKIFVNVIGPDSQDISLRQETRHVSATPVLPGTTVTLDPPLSLNLQRDPWSLTLRFSRDVSYSVRPGEDNRSIVIYLPVVPVSGPPAKKPATD